MERVIFKNSRNQSLVGHLYTSESESIIIMSHGFTGDKSEWGRGYCDSVFSPFA